MNIRSINRYINHDMVIYLKRIGYAIVGKEYRCMDCYTWSLDCSVMKDFAKGLDYLLPKKFDWHVLTKLEKKELLELKELVKTYDDWEFSHKPGKVKEWIRLLKLMDKYFQRLRM